jgi:DNA-binding response OmpR family regulator
MLRKTVLIVDDDVDIRRLAESALKQEGFNVLQAESGENALEILRTTGVDAVILDVLLPGMGGLETLRHIRSDRALGCVPVIMLSVKSSEIDNVVGLELGADDYMGKPLRYHELISRVKSVLRRTRMEQAGTANANRLPFGDGEIDLVSRDVFYQGQKIALTFKEFELLALLVKNPGRVLTRDEILDAIWGNEYALETRTVDVHIRRLRMKFKKAGGDDFLIESIRYVGYRYRAHSPEQA